MTPACGYVLERESVWWAFCGGTQFQTHYVFMLKPPTPEGVSGKHYHYERPCERARGRLGGFGVGVKGGDVAGKDYVYLPLQGVSVQSTQPP